jgi:hypothetical protein
MTTPSHRHLVTIAAATAATLALAAPGVGAHRTTKVSCGQVVTASIRLANDLTGCPDNGLVVGADDITIDLGGHTVEGDGAPIAGCPPNAACDVGVDNTSGHRGVTIRHGVVRNFDVGVSVIHGDDARLRRLTAAHNRVVGVQLIGVARARVLDSTAIANGLDTDGSGIFAVDVQDSRFARNAASDNGDAGLHLVNSRHDAIVGNAVARQNLAIVIDHSDDNDIRRNRSERDGNGLVVVGDRNHVARNIVTDTVRCPDGGCGQGISFEGGTGNTIERNTIERTLEAGIRIAAFEPDTPPAVDNVVRANTVRHSATDGILIDATATGTLVKRNVTTANADDGIDVQNPATTLRRNRADDNGDLGIEAIAGTIDGGHNRADGNGNPAQCTVVVCR